MVWRLIETSLREIDMRDIDEHEGFGALTADLVHLDGPYVDAEYRSHE